MKKAYLYVLATLFCMTASSQNLLEKYKSGSIKLIPDPEYAVGNEWNKVFETYYDTIYNKPMGNRKSIILMPDGSVVVNHAYHNYYSKFDPNGKFVKEFGIIDSQGNQFKKTNHIDGIVNNNTFFTGLDNMGKMICFDFDGHFKKTLTIDYATKQMIALPNGKIAVVGWVIWKTKFRDFVAIVDYNTNEQKVIWEHFTERTPLNADNSLFNYSHLYKVRGAFSFTTMPFSKNLGLNSKPKIAVLGNSLVIAFPGTGEIKIFDLDGNLKSTEQINWERNNISVDEQIEIQKKAIDEFETNPFKIYRPATVSDEEYSEVKSQILKKMKSDLEKIKDPIPLPYFSTIIKDSDDNLLFFEYPKEKNGNKFNVWVYKQSGNFECQSSFVCDDYELEINPSKLVFYNGYIYGLQLKKDVDGNPLRLVRFTLSSE